MGSTKMDRAELLRSPCKGDTCVLWFRVPEKIHTSEITPLQGKLKNPGGRVRIPGIPNFRDNKILVNIRERFDSYKVAIFLWVNNHSVVTMFKTQPILW